MLLDRPGAPLRETTLPRPTPGPGQVLLEVAGLRRLPHRSARGRRRAVATPSCPWSWGTRSWATVAERGAGRRRFAVGERVGVPWLGWTCGVCPYCRAGRENLCDRARFTGYQHRRRLRRVHGRRRALLLSAAGGLRRRRGRAAALRRADRLSRAARWPATRAAPRASTASARRPIIVAQVARHQGRAVFAFTRPGDAARAEVRPRAGRGVGRGVGRAAARAARCGDHVRARRRAGAGRAPRGGQGRHRRLRRDPHERHPVLPVRHPLGRARACARSPTSPGATARSSWRWPRRVPVRTETVALPLGQANEALDRVRSGRLRGAAVLLPG